MRIYLRRRQACVTEQLLYGIEVGSVVEHLGGESVAQNVRTFLVDACDFAKIMCNLSINELVVQLSALVGHQKPSLRTNIEALLLFQFKILVIPINNIVVQRADSFLASFSENFHLTFGRQKVEMLEVD